MLVNVVDPVDIITANVGQMQNNHMLLIWLLVYDFATAS